MKWYKWYVDEDEEGRCGDRLEVRTKERKERKEGITEN